MRRYTIGRHESCDIPVANATVSRRHAELIELGNGQYRLSDLGSTSGTHAYVDGQWVNASGIDVAADTRVGIGEYETTIQELLKLATRAQDEATRAPMMASTEPGGGEPAMAPPPRAPERPAAPAARAEAPAARAAAAAPKRPAPAGPAPAGKGGMSRTTLFVIAGVALFVLVGIAAVVTILLTQGSGTNTAATTGSTAPGRATVSGSDQSRFVTACEKARGANRRACECIAKVALPELNAKERELFIRIMEEGASGDATKMQQLILANRDINAVEFAQKFAGAMSRAGKECG